MLQMLEIAVAKASEEIHVKGAEHALSIDWFSL